MRRFAMLLAAAAGRVIVEFCTNTAITRHETNDATVSYHEDLQVQLADGTSVPR